MKDTYSYKFEGNLYINLTNRCSNDCTFCLRNNGDGIGGHKLWLKNEPDACEVIQSIEEQGEFDEAVFCGYGESTYRVDEITEIARYLKAKGHRTRLDTNGQGNLINGYDITPKLAGLIDVVSVSLNQSTKEKYDQLCHPVFEDAFEELQNFTRKCTKAGIRAIMSVVDIIGEEDIEKCRRIADNCGAVLRVREYIKEP